MVKQFRFSAARRRFSSRASQARIGHVLENFLGFSTEKNGCLWWGPSGKPHRILKSTCWLPKRLKTLCLYSSLWLWFICAAMHRIPNVSAALSSFCMLMGSVWWPSTHADRSLHSLLLHCLIRWVSPCHIVGIPAHLHCSCLCTWSHFF